MAGIPRSDAPRRPGDGPGRDGVRLPDERAGAGGAPDSIETILLATDLTLASSAATDRAIELAVRLGARLLVVHVLSSGPAKGPLARGVTVEERGVRTTRATQVVNRARAEGADASFLVWEGIPGEGILAAAEAEAADLIVVGSHARGSMGRAILGSVSDHLVHRASIPVLVVRPRPSDLS